MAEQLWDQYDFTEIQVAIGAAARLQADTITQGSILQVNLPGEGGEIELQVIDVGKIDPDILGPEEMVDPATQDRAPMPGMLIDLGPLFGGEDGHSLAITFNPGESMPTPSADVLARFNQDPEVIEAYQEAFGGGEIFIMNTKFMHGQADTEVFPATQQDLEVVGMDAAAKAVELGGLKTEPSAEMDMAPPPAQP